jgi:hypothetical protein
MRDGKKECIPHLNNNGTARAKRAVLTCPGRKVRREGGREVPPPPPPPPPP